jgi:hypothetical protein
MVNPSSTKQTCRNVHAHTNSIVSQQEVNCFSMQQRINTLTFKVFDPNEVKKKLKQDIHPFLKILLFLYFEQIPLPEATLLHMATEKAFYAIYKPQ